MLDYSSEATDAELIEAVRGGAPERYEALYRRHVGSAYALARRLGRSAADVDDLVAEAFAKVLPKLLAGGGPTSAFRSYLFTTIRRTAYDKTSDDRRVVLCDTVTAVAEASSGQDHAIAALERSLVGRGFEQLSPRWQAVLWHTEVEDRPHAEVAPILGLSPNAVAALAYRARERLRQEYLQAHLRTSTRRPCPAVDGRLGAWARSALPRRRRVEVEAHLGGCARCRELADELADVNDLRA